MAPGPRRPAQRARRRRAACRRAPGAALAFEGDALRRGGMSGSIAKMLPSRGLVMPKRSAAPTCRLARCSARSLPARKYSSRAGSRSSRTRRAAATTPAGGAGGRDGAPRADRRAIDLPDRRRAADAADVVHRRAAGVADPDADRVAVGEADAPVVAHVLAGAGLRPRRSRASRARWLEPKVRTRALLSARMSVTRKVAAASATRARRCAPCRPASAHRRDSGRRWRACDTRWSAPSSVTSALPSASDAP